MFSFHMLYALSCAALMLRYMFSRAIMSFRCQHQSVSLAASRTLLATKPYVTIYT